MRWLAACLLILGAGACTTTINNPAPTTVPVSVPEPTAPCPTGSVAVSVTSLRSTVLVQGGTIEPGDPITQAATYSVSVAGEITNNTTAVLAVVGPSLIGQLQSGNTFAVEAGPGFAALVPGGSAAFTGETTTDAAPERISSAGTFVWHAPLACGEPAVYVS